MLKGKKILIGVTGSIAAYKIILLVRQLVQQGAEVKIIMTPSAKEFVSPLVLSTLSKHEVLIDLFANNTWSNHVALGRWADIFLIAPLTCNTLSKMAHGTCDNLLLATYLSATCPIAVAPAMDEDMWSHPTTKRNIQLLREAKHHIIDVGSGELASGLFGPGRMAEPEEILLFVDSFFRLDTFRGTKILLTAGPTYEPIDPVRFIGNHSSGKMGIALAEAFYLRGAEVHLIMGPSTITPRYPQIKIYPVSTADEMYQQATSIFPDCQIAVLAAAVADYTPVNVAAEKIKKKEELFRLELRKTKDILKALGTSKTSGQFVVGFALETNNEEDNAQKKRSEKNADLIVLNKTKDAGATFGYDTNKVVIFNSRGNKYTSDLLPKDEIANFIIDRILENNSVYNSL